MAERSDQLTDDSLEDEEANRAIEEAQAVMDRVDTDTDTPAPSGSTEAADRGTDSGGGSLLPSPRSLLPSPRAWLSSLTPSFSKEYFLGALVGVGVAALVGRMALTLLFLGKFGAYLGLFLMAFALSLASGKRRYLEIGLAGLVVMALFAFLGNLSLLGMFSARPLRAAALGGGVGLLLGLLGAYLGRDLRAGLSRDVGDSGGDEPSL